MPTLMLYGKYSTRELSRDKYSTRFRLMLYLSQDSSLTHIALAALFYIYTTLTSQIKVIYISHINLWSGI